MSRKLSQTALIILVLVAPVFGTTIKKMDLPELVSLSDSIVQGTVESVEARWEDKSIYTYTSIRVDEGMKGAPRRAFLVRQPGGKIGALNLNAPGTPQFRQGDQVIVFLRDRKDGTFDVVGLEQGKYEIQNNFAVTNISGLTLADPKTGQLLEAGPADRKPLDTLKTKIRELAR
jgi:hypothetical protein